MKGKLVPIKRHQQLEAPAPAPEKRRLKVRVTRKRDQQQEAPAPVQKKRRLKIRITRKREEPEKIQAWEVAYATVKRLGFEW